MKYAVIFLALLSLALYGVILFLPIGPDSAGTLVGLAILLTAIQFAILRTVRPFSLFGRDLPLLFWLGAIALVIRLVVLVGSEDSSTLSPEAHRYVWEGKMVFDGYNPYTVTPADIGTPEVGESQSRGGIAAPHLPATHPPLAQYLFATAYVLHHDSVHGFRMLSFTFELLTLLAIIVLVAPEIQKRPFQSWSVLIYAFAPAVILPFLLCSHLDILAAPFFIFGLVSLRRGMAARSGILLALAALVTPFPLIVAPIMLFHFEGRERFRFLVGFIAVYILLHLPFVPGAGLDAFTAAFTPTDSLPTNGLIYSALAALLRDPGYALIATGLLLALTVAAAALPLRNRVPQASRRMFFVVAVALLLSPTLYPEHLVWLLPFIVLRRNIPFLAFSATILLTWYPLLAAEAGQTPDYPWWLTLLIYLPVLWLAVRVFGSLLWPNAPAPAKEKGPVIDRPR